jgi:AmmeMemoRadiSam system protein A
MDDAAKRELLKIAREAVSAAVRGEKMPGAKPVSPELVEPRGAFVTIKNRGRLRGCIGQFVADRPLVEMVEEMAVSSATRDPRFSDDPVTPGELDELDVEVSVIGPLERIADPLDFTLGVHGIYIKRGFHHGCFLPQVARETRWSKEQFLSECAEGKAGLAPDAWKDPRTEVLRFTCEVISE